MRFRPANIGSNTLSLKEAPGPMHEPILRSQPLILRIDWKNFAFGAGESRPQTCPLAIEAKSEIPQPGMKTSITTAGMEVLEASLLSPP